MNEDPSLDHTMNFAAQSYQQARPDHAGAPKLKAFRLASGETFAALTAQDALNLAHERLNRPWLGLKDLSEANHTDLLEACLKGTTAAVQVVDHLTHAQAPGYLGRCQGSVEYKSLFVEDLEGNSLAWAMREASFRAFGFATVTPADCPDDFQRNAIRRWIGDVVCVPVDQCLPVPPA